MAVADLERCLRANVVRIVQGLEAAARFRGQHRAISDASHQDIPYPPDPNDDAGIMPRQTRMNLINRL